jgi:uncharacterized membrane protein YwzB
MGIRTILYIFIVPMIMFTLESLNIERFFKKNRVLKMRFFYLFLTLGMSYLTVNFLMDFFISTQF